MRQRPAPPLALLLVAALARAEGVPSCDAVPNVFRAWTKLRAESVGITAYDDRPFLDPTLVPFPGRPAWQSCPTEVDFSSDQEGRASDGIHPWIAASPCKVTACGKPLSFEQNRGLALISGEYDLNNNISLDAAAKRRLDRYGCFPEARKTMEDSMRLAFQDPRLCFPETEYLHVEITPPRRLRPLLSAMWTGDGGYEWFRWRSLLHGEQLCTYGPFVADLAHATKAEIHPAQLLWWNERSSVPDAERGAFSPDGPWALFLQQDGSNRYSQRHHFILSAPPPLGTGWQPWAAAPITGVFEVAFFTGKEETAPPQFELRPYEYDGLRAGAPSYSPCPQERIATLEAELAGVERRTVARVCDSTHIQPPSHIRIEGQVLCECIPRDPPEKDGCEKAGYLAKLTIRAQTGSNREWGEGGFALLLTDSRAKERGRARATLGEVGGATLRKDARLVPQLSWKPAGSWQRAEPTDPGTTAAVVRWLFKQAGWPIEWVSPPLPSLWRLRGVALNLDVNLDLPEKQKKDKKVVADWAGARVAETSGPSASAVLAIVPDGDHRANLSLAKLPPLTAHRIEVTAGAKEVGPGVERLLVETPETRGAAEKAVARPSPHLPRVPAERFVLWSHGLGATPAKDWQDAARALCTHCSKPSSECGSGLVTGPEPAHGQEQSDPGNGGLLETDLRVVVGRTLKDQVVSATELSLLVQDIKGLCRPDERTGPPRPVLLQEK